jgi:hypothetical protein
MSEGAMASVRLQMFAVLDHPARQGLANPLADEPSRLGTQAGRTDPLRVSNRNEQVGSGSRQALRSNP